MSADAAAVEGADDVLDLGEGDAVIYESDDCEGCFSPDGTDWTADVEEEEKEGPEYGQSRLDVWTRVLHRSWGLAELKEEEEEVDTVVEQDRGIPARWVCHWWQEEDI